MQLYLVTGFLGAGKTTFLKKLAAIFSRQRLYLIINEFGKEDVDGKLLAELDAQLAEISNGSIFCACRINQFESELHRAIAAQPDVILVEASGLADPTNVRRVLDSFPSINYKGCICLADAARLQKVFSTARVCPKQLAVASLVLLNKTDTATPTQISETQELIAQANPAAHIVCTTFGSFDPAWLDFVHANINMEQALETRDITLQKVTLHIHETMPPETLRKCLAMLCEDTYRIKGFVKLCDETYFADCTGPAIALSPWQGECSNRLMLLAGTGMPLRKAIQNAMQWYGEFIEIEA